MSRVLLLFLLLVTLAACTSGRVSEVPTPPAPPAPLLLEEVTWKLCWQITCRNSGPKPTSIRVEMPLPQDRGGWQTVRQTSLQPAPNRRETDPFGNKLAVYEWAEVPAGSSVQAQVEAVIQRQSAAFCPDASRVRSPGSGPSRFLVAEPGILADDPVILRTAAAVVGDEHNPYYRLVRLYDFVRGLDYQLTRPAQDDHESLASRVVQCSDAAGLLVSLSRAAGIPARYVAGVFLRPETPRLQFAHAWAEAWIEPHGWLPVDPTMGRFADTRTTRLGQLDPAYVVTWEGRGSRGFAVQGARDSEVSLVLHQELVSRRAPSSPSLKVPSLMGPRDLTPMLPTGRALELLKKAMEPGLDAPSRIRACREGLKLAPDSKALMRALVFASPAGPARQALEEELAKAPSSPNALFGRGLLALEEERWSQAEDLLGAAGEDFPVQHALAELFIRTCQPGRASEALAQATRQAVTFRLAQSATHLFADLGDWAGLAQVAEEAARIYPASPEFELARAQALFRLGDQEASEALVARMRIARPGDGLPDAMLGLLHLENGRPDRALQLLRRGLRTGLDPAERDFFADLARQVQEMPDQEP